MGCNNTKQSVQHSELKEEELDKITAVDEEAEQIDNVIVPPRKDDLTITIEKTDASEKVGMLAKYSSPKKCVFSVKQIYEEGAVYKYNASASIETQVQTGDFIWDVNGVSGDVDKMLEELKRATTCIITLQRQPRCLPETADEKTPLLASQAEDLQLTVNSDEANPKLQEPVANVDDEILPTKATLEVDVAADTAKPDRKEKAADEVAEDIAKPDIEKPATKQQLPFQLPFDRSMLGPDMSTQAVVVPHADEVGPAASDQRSMCCSSAPTACT